MTDKTPASREDLAAAILPAVIAGGNWDDFNPDFTCPLTNTNYFVVPFKGADLDEGEKPWFRIDAMNGDSCAGHICAKDLDECQQIIAKEIADSLIASKSSLLKACLALGLQAAPRVGTQEVAQPEAA